MPDKNQLTREQDREGRESEWGDRETEGTEEGTGEKTDRQLTNEDSAVPS